MIEDFPNVLGFLEAYGVSIAPGQATVKERAEKDGIRAIEFRQ
jgi:hypothetical protein